MKILVTCDRYPWQMSEGLVLRIRHYVRTLGGRHRFDLACLCKTGDEFDPEVETLFGQVHKRIYDRASRAEAAQGFMARAFPGIGSLYPNDPALRAWLQTLIDSGEYDLIWDAGCNLLFNLVPLSGRPPILVDQVDDATLALERRMKDTTGLADQLRLWRHLNLQRAFAREVLSPLGPVLFVSDLDAEHFRKVAPNAQVAVINNGVDIDYFRPRATPAAESPSSNELVFEGVMAFEPNVDAARHMVQSILPLIERQVPDVSLTLAGRDPVDSVRALVSENVRVTGAVPDVRPYLEAASVFVCPMRLGAGIKNKILQAWAMGKAVVSTPEGAAGLNARDGENIIVRSAPDDFARAVVDLLRQPERRAGLAAAGRSEAVDHYSWAAKADELDDLMRQVASRNTSHRAGTRV